MKDGLGNWAEAAAHIGTRTKEDCEEHYHAVYLGVGPDGKELDHVWEPEAPAEQVEGPPRKKRRREFMPVSCLDHRPICVKEVCTDIQPMNLDIKVDHADFQEKKRERIEDLRKPQGVYIDMRIGCHLTHSPTVRPHCTARFRTNEPRSRRIHAWSFGIRARS